MGDLDSPATCFISTRVRHRVATITIHDDVLILVRRGIKTVLNNACATVGKAGAAIVMARGMQCDVVNDPSGDGRYEALVIQFGDQAITDFQRRFGAEFGQDEVKACFSMVPGKEFEDAAVRAADAIGNSDVSVHLRSHKVTEVLLMLAERGCVLRPRVELLWPERVRRIVANRPHVPWTVDSLASACATSASTLRRRLAAHDFSVGGLIRDVRLEVAMILLQTTGLPIGDVAQRCGYESHSRFSALFKVRYGYPPSYLR